MLGAVAPGVARALSGSGACALEAEATRLAITAKNAARRATLRATDEADFMPLVFGRITAGK
jgi:hypothetical protein